VRVRFEGLSRGREKIKDKFTVIKAGIKSLRAMLPDESFLLVILLLEPCISLIYA
jgi:hypothetical protein